MYAKLFKNAKVFCTSLSCLRLLIFKQNHEYGAATDKLFKKKKNTLDEKPKSTVQFTSLSIGPRNCRLGLEMAHGGLYFTTLTETVEIFSFCVLQKSKS